MNGTQVLKEWGYIALRLPQVIWAAAVGMARTAGPSITMTFSMLVAYLMGEVGANVWFVIVPMITGGFAITLAADRAEAKASTDYASRLFGLIEREHSLEITVTTKTE